MKKIDLKAIKHVKDYLIIENDKLNIVFTTAEKERSFNRATDSGVKHLNSLKEDFKLKDVIYLKQIHSDTIYKYDLNNNVKELEGDAIITDVKNTAVGAFTADCVPVILTDEKKGVVCAIHSGWRGTFESITHKAVEKMYKEYNCSKEDIKAYIGAHIRQCCYEISEELKEKFIEKKNNIDEDKLFKGRNLSMEVCIEDDLLKAGVNEENIYSLGLCTYCGDEIKLFSYRKSEGSYGRMFSFVFLK